MRGRGEAERRGSNGGVRKVKGWQTWEKAPGAPHRSRKTVPSPCRLPGRLLKISTAYFISRSLSPARPRYSRLPRLSWGNAASRIS